MNMKDFIIIDIQGFQFKNNEYIPKELAFYDSEHRIGHYIFESPYHESVLSSKNRRTANWLIKYHHGIDWNDEFVQGSKFGKIISFLTNTVKFVYVKGSMKADILKGTTNATVIDMSDEGGKLMKTFPMCGYHKRGSNCYMCSLSNVFQLHRIAFARLEKDKAMFYETEVCRDYI